MSITSNSFKDRFDDTLDVDIYDSFVDFDVKVGDEYLALSFSNEESLAVASFILENVKPAVAHAEKPVSADPVTLFSGESGNEREEWNRVAALAANKLGLSLSFKYAKSETAPIESRTLASITNVVQSAEGYWLVIGHSDERDDARSFRVDRMVSYAIADK